MRKRLQLPPELAAAIELTAEFRQAMGLPTQYSPPPIRVPMSEAVTQIPEWQAATGQISAEEYLACFGYSDAPIQRIKHGLAGKSSRRKKRDVVE